MVVPSTVVANELDIWWQGINQLLVESAGQGDTIEGSGDTNNVVVLTALQIADEAFSGGVAVFFAVDGNDIVGLLELSPFALGVSDIT